MSKSFRDHLGREVLLSARPERVISLCPSQTETLFDLGVGDRVVGRTRYCIHPATDTRQVCVVGGTKKVDFSLIRSLQPDLIIAEKEENPKELVELASQIAPVFVTDVVDEDSAYQMIQDLGQLFRVSQTAASLTATIQTSWGQIQALHPAIRVAYLIWKKPWMAVGPQTFIHSVLTRVGFRNVFSEGPDRYPEITLKSLIEASPELILLSSEPFPFTQSHAEELKKELPHSRILLVDGESWSWYGSRMQTFPKHFNSLRRQILLTGGEL